MGVMSKPRRAVYARDLADVVSRVLVDYARDRRLCTAVVLGFTGLAAYAHYQTSQPAIAEQFHLVQEEARARSRAKRERRARRTGSAVSTVVSSAARDGTPSSSAPASDNEGSKHGGGDGGKALAETRAAAPVKRKVAAVDATFLKRMAFILRIVIPGITCKESVLLAIQTVMLVTRSFISLRIARKGGDGLQAVMERSWKKFFMVLGDFFVSGVAASVVNSALKYLTNSITVAFRQRLTAYVHARYLSNRAYYRAAVLRVGNLDNADQRIVEDLHQFCATASDLFARTFKPLLDVVLSTHRMGEHMGYSGLTILYSYFFLSGAVIRAVSPPFSEYIARTQKLEGDFRRMHSRLITHAEEVAFLDGAAREQDILDSKLDKTTTWSSFYFYLQFKQGVIDQYFVKYFASMIGLPVLAFPFMADTSSRSAAEIAARYRESDTLIQSASSSIGDLMMVYKKLQRLAGFTARVMDLLEAVDSIHDTNKTEKADAIDGGSEWEGEDAGESKSDHESESVGSVGSMVRNYEKRTGGGLGGGSGGGGRGVIASSSEEGVSFSGVTVYSPDGRLLVKRVNLTLAPGENLFVTGANGAGKTSLFRVLAGLWEPTAGTVTRPDVAGASNDSFQGFYVPQKPYLVSGTLRDQVMYPLPGDPTRDDEVVEALTRVNLMKLARTSSDGLDRFPHDWADVLSGGEKQRVGLARLYFHKPAYAVLDEATSAINPDEEGAFYSHLGTLGITAFSIAHRLELKRFHHQHLHFHADGTGGWTLDRIQGGKR